MARKKKTPSDTDKASKAPEAEVKTPVADKQPSKAGAISGAMKGADFDAPDEAMADTSLAEKDAAADVEEAEIADEADDVTVDQEAVGASDAIAEDPEDIDQANETEIAPEDAPAPEEPVAPAAAPVAPAPHEQTNGFGGMVLGGVIAAIIGFGGAIIFDAAQWPVFGGKPDVDVAQLVGVQSARIDAITAQIDGQLAEQIAALEAQIAAAQASDAEALNALGVRIDALPAFGGPEILPEELQATLAAQKAEMAALQDNLNAMAALAQDQIANAQAEQESAAKAEARVKARGALNAVRAAMGTGDAFADALPDIAAAADVPDALARVADSGVPTATSLEAGFSDSARAALSSSLKETAGSAPTDRLALFLKDQLGARSLTPRDGDDPDAVLSRVEAAMKAGDLDGALTTLTSLPEAGQADLEAWAQDVQARKDALEAFEALSDALSAN